MATILIPHGYTVINTKSKTFVDYDGSEGSGYETWDNFDGANEILNEIYHFIKSHDSVKSRKARKNRKHFSVVKISLSCIPVN
jgi:hypothetical protein